MGEVKTRRGTSRNVGRPNAGTVLCSLHELGAGPRASHFLAGARVERRRIRAGYTEMFCV